MELQLDDNTWQVEKVRGKFFAVVTLASPLILAKAMGPPQTVGWAVIGLGYQ